ncbi:phosphoenolpyruvate carboxykinase (ATP) [Dyadobacter helix]|nr:serine kinase [Dyadobacter sp. CECT 9275]
MYFYRAFGLNIHAQIELPELSPSDNLAPVDLMIEIGQVILPKTRKTRIYRRGIRADFGSDDQQNIFLHWEGVADYQAIDGHKLLIAPATEDKNLLSLFTVSEALGLILFQRGLFLLHASAVKVGDRAWCFMGNPGAGKSTTAAAFLKSGHRLLSDDLTAITFDKDGQAFIVPAYPQLKIWDNTVSGLNYDPKTLEPVSEGVNKYSFQPRTHFSHEPVRLGHIIFLHKAKNKPAKEELGPAKVPIELLKNFPLPAGILKGNLLKNHFLQSFQCARSARLWSKRRPKSFDDLESWAKSPDTF